LQGSATGGGIQEFNSLAAYVGNNDGAGTPPGVYQGDLTPSNMDDVAVSDANILARAGASGIRVFTFTNTGIVADTYSWGQGTDPQVAVWMTTFDDQNNGYPYQNRVDLTNGATCVGACRMVTYALGRSGFARQMVRETHSVISQKLTGVSAMTNAPNGGDFAELCNPGSGLSDGTANATPWTNGTTGFDNAVIEATQAPYLLGSVPSGTALSSNTELGSGGKGFRSDLTSQTGASFSEVPYIIYSGHDTSRGFKVDWASTTSNAAGVTMPAGELPTKLVNAPLLGDDAIDYFSDPNTQLFSMDTYRWAAEQFTCQDPAQNDGQAGNGIYCSKAEGLRQALVTMGYPAYAPVTGRLTIAQIQYNIANGIPMFGIIRLMFPAVPDGNSDTCNGVFTALHVIESAGEATNGSYDFNKLMACDPAEGCAYTGSMPNPNGGAYAFTVADGAVPDDDGDLGSNARLMVYGTLLIDYFADYDIEGGATGPGAGTDTVFNPADGERLLLPLESPDVYLAVEHNMMINPVMPRFEGNASLAFPTAAPVNNPNASTSSPSRLGNGAPALDTAAGTALAANGRVNMSGNGNPFARKVNLASPYEGFFPVAEGMLPVIGVGPAGTMRLMSRATPADNPGGQGLLSMTVGDFGVGNEIAATTQGMRSLSQMSAPGGGQEGDVLRYYYELMAKVIDPTQANDWPIAPWPGNNFSSNFCIGLADCGAGGTNNHMGDKLHLMFPTGYMHAWKVALAALDVSADEWNNILSGGDAPQLGIANANGLRAQLVGGCGGACSAGLPFHFTADIGGFASNIQNLESEESTYFNITQDPYTGYGLLDSKWIDIPSTMYSGGLLDMHAHSNMTGIIYTPGPLEWEPGNSDYDTGVHMSYVNGSIITGFGAFTKNQGADDRYVIVFDMQAVDNINVNNQTIVMRRYDWQMLH